MIRENTQKILQELPLDVTLVGAAKSRTADEINQAIEGGLKVIGHNYIQEAEAMQGRIGKVSWHFIGHLQQNKISKAVALFDTIETIDGYQLASSVSEKCLKLSKQIDLLIEINSGNEENKSGVPFKKVRDLVILCSHLPSTRLRGLMTMGPAYLDGEQLRPYFAATRECFAQIRKEIPLEYFDSLSMGMSGSYRQAIAEGATIVRIGSAIFGSRL